jgi:hypothetical protein
LVFQQIRKFLFPTRTNRHAVSTISSVTPGEEKQAVFVEGYIVKMIHHFEHNQRLVAFEERCAELVPGCPTGQGLGASGREAAEVARRGPWRLGGAGL